MIDREWIVKVVKIACITAITIGVCILLMLL